MAWSAVFRVMGFVCSVGGVAVLLFGWVPPGLVGQPRQVVLLSGSVLLLWGVVMELRASVSELKREGGSR